MANPKFYGCDISSWAITASAGSASGYSTENLKDYLPSTKWRSAATTEGQTLTIDFGSVKPVDFLAYRNSYFPVLDGGYNSVLEFDLNDNPSFTDPETMAEISGGTSADNIHTFGQLSRRYWRLTLACAGSTPEFGMILLGESLTMPFPRDFGGEVGNPRFQTSRREALDGFIRTARTGLGRRMFSMTFSALPSSLKADWIAFLQAVQGSLRPFLYQDEDGSVYLVHFEDDYLPLRDRRANINDLVTIKMIEQQSTL